MGYDHATIALYMDSVLFEEAAAEGEWGQIMGSSLMPPPQENF